MPEVRLEDHYTVPFRTKRRRAAQGESYPWIVRATGVVNQF